MGELWWTEAVIPVDRQPDWTAAYAAIATLTVDRMDFTFDDYASRLDLDALAAADPPAAAALMLDAGGPGAALLLPHVRRLVTEDLDMVVDVLSRGRPLVCAFEVATLRVFVHCSGYTCGEPDGLCDAWLNLTNLGILEAAGFLRTHLIDGGAAGDAAAEVGDRS